MTPGGTESSSRSVQRRSLPKIGRHRRKKSRGAARQAAPSSILAAMETTLSNQPASPHYGPRQRVELLVLEAIAGVSAVAGGIGLVFDWLGVNKSRLDGSPFNSFLIPGLILLVAVGGLLLSATWMVWTRSKLALEVSLAAGFILLGWFSVQIIMIGLFNWLQPIMASVGVAIAVIAVSSSRR